MSETLELIKVGLIDQKISGRDCGHCTACCSALSIEVLDKPAGVACKHLCAKGCGIYPDRPMVCKSWWCLWRMYDLVDETLGKEIRQKLLRPDVSGLLIELERFPGPGGQYFHFIKVHILAMSYNREVLDLLSKQLPVVIDFNHELAIWPNLDKRYRSVRAEQLAAALETEMRNSNKTTLALKQVGCQATPTGSQRLTARNQRRLAAKASRKKQK